MKYAKKKGYSEISTTQFFGDLEISRKTFKVVYKQPENEVFTDKEVIKIADYIFDGHQDLMNLGILLAFETGMRAGELSVLRHTDFNLNKQTVTVSKTEIRYYDTNKTTVHEVRESPKTENGFREIYLTPEAIEIYKKIRAINPFTEYIFDRDNTTEKYKGRIHAEAFSQRLRRICRNIGINPRSMHKARKTYATKLINANVNEKLIQEQMGHSDIETTRKYYYYRNYNDDAAKEEILKALKYV